VKLIPDIVIPDHIPKQGIFLTQIQFAKAMHTPVEHFSADIVHRFRKRFRCILPTEELVGLWRLRQDITTVGSKGMWFSGHTAEVH
jgi:hypothetical protein